MTPFESDVAVVGTELSGGSIVVHKAKNVK